MAKTATKAKTKPAEKPKPAAPQRSAQTASRASVPATVKREPPPRQEVVGSKDFAKLNDSVPAEVLANLPAHMRGDVGLGKENITQSDMDMPRLKLIQGTSKELQLYDDLRPGHFFHTASETVFDEAFRVVPVFMDKQYILWRPLEDGGGILARASDGVHWAPSSGEFTVKLDRKDGGSTEKGQWVPKQVTWKLARTVQESGLANWGTHDPDNNNSPPAATMMYNFLLAFPDHPELMPAVLTFQRSSIKVGRKFMTKLMTVRSPLFGSVFSLSSTDEQNTANQDYKNISIVGDGLVQDEKLYNLYKDIYMSLSKTGLNIRDIDSLQGDGDAIDGAAGGGDPNKPAY